jgi:DNA-binding transcriptional LysR family regulator
VNWDLLRIFLAVAEAGSFTQAGKAVKLSQSAVSRQMAKLEQSLGVSLFHRHSRGLVLTEQGEDFFRTVKEMSAKLGMAEAIINESRERPEGPLKIATSVGFGSAWLTSRMNEFIALFPDISVTLLLTDSLEPNLSLREADVAIRFTPQRQPNLIQRRLMSVRYHVFASKKYLDKNGTPQQGEDLDHHQIIVYGDETPAPISNINWLLEAGARQGRAREPALRVNSVYGIYRAVLSGLGIAALPYYMIDESLELVEILPELRGPSFDVFFVYPEELRHSKRITSVRDFLVDMVKKDSVKKPPKKKDSSSLDMC